MLKQNQQKKIYVFIEFGNTDVKCISAKITPPMIWFNYNFDSFGCDNTGKLEHGVIAD